MRVCVCVRVFLREKDSDPHLLTGENCRARRKASHFAHKGNGYKYGNQMLQPVRGKNQWL